ncbi:MAG: hypothetical protein MUC78_10980 [Bacteroidales bacterium]|jgi:hypothetical protein|nr:hypothetical protein [Bacteroidales bacterium]
MKKTSNLMLMVVAVLFAATGCQKIEEDIDVSLKSSGIVTIVNNWKSGNATFECKSAGGECGFAFKIDEWDEYLGMDGTYETMEGNTIVILNSNGKTFDWKSEYPVCKVIVKAGRGAYIYSYPGGACHDEGLIGFQGKGISHVSFCYSIPIKKIIAAKFVYTDGVGEYFGVTDGTSVFDSGWCSEWFLGVNDYPSVKTIPLHRAGVFTSDIGTITVDGSGDITINLDKGLSLVQSSLFVGTERDLKAYLSPYDDCPAYYNLPWIHRTSGDLYFFDLPNL